MFKLDFLVGEAFNNEKIFHLFLHVEQPRAFRHTSLAENLKKKFTRI